MEKILERLAKMDQKLDKLDEIQKGQIELKNEMTLMKKDVKDVQQLADQNKQRVGGLEGQMRVLQRADEGRGNAMLTLQLDKMSYFLRFQNVEQLDQENLRQEMIQMLSEFLQRDLELIERDVDLVYRVNSQFAILHNVPREVHIKFVKRELRDEILRKQRQGALTYRGKEVTILKQVPRQVRELRRKYYFLTNKLYLKGVGFRWLIPEGLMIFWEGTREKITNVLEAKAFFDKHKSSLETQDTGAEEGEVSDDQGAGADGAVVVREEGGGQSMVLRARPKK